MTLMSMFKAGDIFAAGVAGAPVTEWRLYDSHYTERYMGDPRVDGDAYTASSVFPYAEGLKGPLLIVHGMADDNVPYAGGESNGALDDPRIFYDARGSEERFERNSRKMLESVQQFLDLTKVDAHPMSEYVLGDPSRS